MQQQIIVHSTPEELLRAKKWWKNLEAQWQLAFNQAVFGKGPVFEPPHDDALMTLLVRADTLRFAGPLAYNPNMTTVLTNLSGLVPLYHLYCLSISNMDLQNLQALKRHQKLEHLFVYENKLKSLEGIENMKNLKDLYFQNNQVTSLKPLKKLTKLETVYASNNKFTEIKGLTEKHADSIKKLYMLPNEGLKDRDIIKFQNSIGIICHKG